MTDIHHWMIFLAILAVAIGAVTILVIDSEDRRKACQLKGGTYITPVYSKPVCIDSKSVIPIHY